MLAAVAQISQVAVKRLLILTFLSVAGIAVGIACALFPLAVPFAAIGVAALILFWVMPELAFVPIDLARILIVPFVFSVISVPAYYAIVLHDAPWISIRRSLLFALVTTTIFILAGSKKYRQILVIRLRRSPYLAFLVIGFFVVQLLAVLTSVKPATSIGDVINTTINYYIPLIAVILVADRREDVDALINTMIFALIASCIFGAIEFYLKHPFLYLALPSWVTLEILAQNPIAPMRSTVVNAIGYRATSTFMVSLSWAEFAMMMTPFALQRLLYGRTKVVKVLGLTALLAIGASLTMSGSRGGYVGFLADSGLFLFACTLRYINRNWQSILSAILTVLFAVTSMSVAAAVLFVPNIRIKVLGGGARAASDQGRHEQWALAIPKFFSRPFLGYGPGTAADVVGWVAPSGLPSLDSYAINVMISTGVLGMLFFIPMILLPSLYTLRIDKTLSDWAFGTRASLSCAIFGYAVYRTSLNQSENNTIVFVILGLLFVVNALIEADGRTRAGMHGERGMQASHS